MDTDTGKLVKQIQSMNNKINEQYNEIKDLQMENLRLETQNKLSPQVAKDMISIWKDDSSVHGLVSQVQRQADEIKRLKHQLTGTKPLDEEQVEEMYRDMADKAKKAELAHVKQLMDEGHTKDNPLNRKLMD